MNTNITSLSKPFRCTPLYTYVYESEALETATRCDTSDENLKAHGFYLYSKEYDIWIRQQDGDYPGMPTWYRRYQGRGLVYVGQKEEKWVQLSFGQRYMPQPSTKRLSEAAKKMEILAGLTATTKFSKKQAMYRIRKSFRTVESFNQLVKMAMWLVVILSTPVEGRLQGHVEADRALQAGLICHQANCTGVIDLYFQGQYSATIDTCCEAPWRITQDQGQWSITCYRPLVGKGIELGASWNCDDRFVVMDDCPYTGDFNLYGSDTLRVLDVVCRTLTLLFRFIGFVLSTYLRLFTFIPVPFDQMLLISFTIFQVGLVISWYHSYTLRRQLARVDQERVEFLVRSGSIYARRNICQYEQRGIQPRMVETKVEIPKSQEGILPGSQVTQVSVSRYLIEFCYELKGEMQHLGWGVSVAQGVGLTAQHVLDDWNTLVGAGPLQARIHTKDSTGSKLVPIQELSRHPEVDLALVSLPWGLTTARLTRVEPGQSVVMLASGTLNKTSDDAWAALGQMTVGTIAGFESQGLTCQHTLSTHYGNSGLPLWRGNAVGAIHSSRYYKGVSNLGVVMTSQVIQWVQTAAQTVRSGTLEKPTESMNLADFLDFHRKTATDLKFNPNDHDEASIMVDGVEIVLDLSNPSAVFATAQSEEGEYVPVSNRTLKGRRGAGVKSQPAERQRRRHMKQLGMKPKFTRNSKRAGRAKQHLKRLTGPQESACGDPELIDSGDEELDLGKPYVAGAIVEQIVAPRHVTQVEDIDTKLDPVDFGLEAVSLEQWSKPDLTRKREHQSAEQISKLGGEIGSIPGYKKLGFVQYLNHVFKHRAVATKPLDFDEAWAIILSETGDKTPGFKFMCYSECGQVHQTKQSVNECKPCSIWLRETVERIWNGVATDDDWEVVLNVFLKEEHTSQKKLAEGRQRLIYGGDLVLEVLQRRMHHKAYQHNEKAGTINPTILGYCLVHGGHKAIADKLSHHHLFEVDVSSMDLRLSGELIGLAYDAWCHVMRIDTNLPASKYERRFLVGEKLMRIDDHVEAIGSSARPRLGLNPSGHFLTTIINSYATLFVYYDFAMSMFDKSMQPQTYTSFMALSYVTTAFQAIIHGDDAVFGISRDAYYSIDVADVSTRLTNAYERVGLSNKVCKYIESPVGMTFLGFVWKKDAGMYKIKPANPDKLFLRLQKPLRASKLQPEVLAQTLQSLSIISVNDPQWYQGLVKMAVDRKIELPDKQVCVSIMDGSESLPGDGLAKLNLTDEAYDGFTVSKASILESKDRPIRGPSGDTRPGSSSEYSCSSGSTSISSYGSSSSSSIQGSQGAQLAGEATFRDQKHTAENSARAKLQPPDEGFGSGLEAKRQSERKSFAGKRREIQGSVTAGQKDRNSNAKGKEQSKVARRKRQKEARKKRKERARAEDSSQGVSPASV